MRKGTSCACASLCLSAGAGYDALASMFALRRLAWEWGSVPGLPRQCPPQTSGLCVDVDARLRAAGQRLASQSLPLLLEQLEIVPLDHLRPAGDHRQRSLELRLLDVGGADDHDLAGPPLADDELELLGVDPHPLAVGVEVHLEDEALALDTEDALPPVVVTMCR